MTRLTNSIRDQIKNLALHKAFEPRALINTNLRASLALDIYQEVFGEIEPQLKALPEGFVPTSYGIIANFHGERESFFFNGIPSNYACNHDYKFRALFPERTGVTHLVPFWAHTNWEGNQADTKKAFEAQHDFCKRRLELSGDLKDLRSEWTTAGKTIEATLAKFSNIKKLVAAWPEIEELIPEKSVPVVEVINLPATILSDLNTLIGLPSPKEDKPVEGDIHPSWVAAA